MNIRKASVDDFEQLYKLSLQTQEFSYSTTEVFAEPEEFKHWLIDKESVFFLAEDDKEIIGFIYATVENENRSWRARWAMIEFLMVQPTHRKKGVAALLYSAMAEELEKHQITNIGCWTCVNSPVSEFMRKRGFISGKSYQWMDKRVEISNQKATALVPEMSPLSSA